MHNIGISFRDATFSLPAVRDKYDLLLGVEALFSLSVAGKIIYTEPMFPIVELRQALRLWLPPALDDFEFSSMESDDIGLVWFRRQGPDRWRAGSIHQERPALEELYANDVAKGCIAFIDAVDSWVRADMNLEVGDVLRL